MIRARQRTTASPARRGDRPLSRVALLLVIGLLSCHAIVACGGNADAPAAHSSGPDACPPLPTGDGSAPWLTGTIVGGSLQATLCPGGIQMFFSPDNPMDPPPVRGTLAGGLPLYGAGVVFGSPQNALVWELNISLTGGYLEGGTYESPDGGLIATLDFEYVIPDSPGIDCTMRDSSASCPPGCDLVPQPCDERCAPFPCRPHGTLVTYGADYYSGYSFSSQSGFVYGASPQTGFVTFHVSSVTPIDADAGTYALHGSFTGTLADIDGGADTVTMNMSF
jgi:hypothetical protein